MSKVKKFYLVSIILLLISFILWSDLSFLFIGLSIVNVGIILLIQINSPENKKNEKN